MTPQHDMTKDRFSIGLEAMHILDAATGNSRDTAAIVLSKRGKPVCRIYWHNPSEQICMETEPGVCISLDSLKDTVLGMMEDFDAVCIVADAMLRQAAAGIDPEPCQESLFKAVASAFVRCRMIREGAAA